MRADALGAGFIETSAKAGINVKTLFKNIAATLPGIETGSAVIPNRETANELSTNRIELSNLAV